VFKHTWWRQDVAPAKQVTASVRTSEEDLAGEVYPRIYIHNKK